MCGIVGIAEFSTWGIGSNEKNVLKQLLVADSLRGMMGTGVFVVKSDGECRARKIGGSPIDLFRDKEFEKFLFPDGHSYDQTKPHDVFAVGHNRYKTSGQTTTAHAHPHRVGKIVLVHNGTLREQSKLPDYTNFDVDTMALANAIDKLGIEETISKTYGSYAIIYYNGYDKTINILRNSERPLFMARGNNFHRVYLASERKMLDWILERNSMTIDTMGIEAVKEDTLYTFHFDSDTPEKKSLPGPRLNCFYKPTNIWEQMEVDLTERLETSSDSCILLSDKIKDKRVKKIMKRFEKTGMQVQVIPKIEITDGKNTRTLKRGELCAFRVNDYSDIEKNDPNNEWFMVMGNSTLWPATCFRFKVVGEKDLNMVFDAPLVTATVQNIVCYPEATENDDKYVVWVNNVCPYIPKQDPTATKTGTDLTLYEEPDIL